MLSPSTALLQAWPLPLKHNYSAKPNSIMYLLPAPCLLEGFLPESWGAGGGGGRAFFPPSQAVCVLPDLPNVSFPPVYKPANSQVPWAAQARLWGHRDSSRSQFHTTLMQSVQSQKGSRSSEGYLEFSGATQTANRGAVTLKSSHSTRVLRTPANHFRK